MRQLTIEKSFILIIEDEIKKFEIANNVLLPLYLINFFIKYNGASIKEYIYYHNDTLYVINSFLPLLKIQNRATIEDFLPWIRDEEFMIGRYDLIPFAVDPGNHPFLVSIGREDEGVVYYSIVGWGEDKPLRKIADSFEEFINGLHAEDE